MNERDERDGATIRAHGMGEQDEEWTHPFQKTRAPGSLHQLDTVATLLAIFEDGDKFEGGWKEWEKRAKELEDDLKRQGLIVERAYIDPDTFADWCRRNGVGTGREGRAKFAEFAAEKYGRNQS